MREPKEIAAAIDIAVAMRGALADQFDRYKATGWDEEVLMIELGRVFGAILRWQDARPSVVEWLVSRGQVVLLIAYTKSKFDNLPAEFLVRLKEQYDV